MVTLRTVIFFILFVSFMVFVTFFGRLPALRRTPIGGLHRLLWIHIPNAALAADQRLTSGQVSKSVKRFCNYLMYDRHPTVVVLFAAIMLVAEAFFMPRAWPQIGWFTKLTAIITILLPYLFLYLACASDPGYITPDMHAYYMSLYPYDHAIYHPGNECRTCRHLKPARSKHCSICKRCVAKSDHHCIFINSCVGYGNQHWFLLLLVSTGVLTVYGGVLGICLVAARVRTRYPAWSAWPSSGMTWAQWANYLGWGFQKDPSLGCSTLLAAMISPMVWGLTLYSLYLVYCGVTTNESLKWSDWKEDMRDGLVFERHMPSDRTKNPNIEPLWTRWPWDPEHIMVATSDGQAPRGHSHIPGVGEWQRVWKLDNVNNLYDLGLMENLRDIFIADYDFKGSINGKPKQQGYMGG